MNHALKSLSFAGLACTSLLFPTPGSAAPGTPDAGAIQQQMEQTLRQAAPLPAPAAKAQAAPATADSGERVTVSAFEFAGNTLIDTSVLQKAAQGFLNKPLTLTELRKVTEAVQQVYREANWMVRVFLPAQEILNGQVRIEIVEAKLGKVVQAGQSSRVKDTLTRGIAGHQLHANEPIHMAALERGLMLLSDLPGITASASFAPGEQAGQTDLVIQVEDKAQVNGSVSLDNMGSSATGQQRLLGTVNVNGPLQIGDLMTVSALATDASHYARASYSIALGTDGWRLGVHASDMGYHGRGDSSALKGNASTYGLDASYPIIRSQARTIAFNAGMDQKAFRNEDGASNGSDFQIQVANAGLSASTQDSWAGGGINNVAATWSLGQVKPNTQLPDSSTQGQFSKWLLLMGRNQSLTPQLSINATAQVQRASKPLDSSEKMYLGGAYGVRAYATSEGAASEGESLSVEMSHRLQERLSLNGFYDWAHARNTQASEQALRNFYLRGFGLSASWQASPQIQIKAIAAHRIGDGSLPSASYSTNRVWLSAFLSF